ncbi:MAG: Smr/MutS family protein [Acidobacteriota bacterium]|nr:Smr/MutS family protein [Acidobacteriota bacterium]
MPLAAPTHATGAFSGPTLTALELPSLLAVLSTLAASDLGRQRILGLTPATSPEELAERRKIYQECVQLLAQGRLIPSFEEDLEPVLERLDTGRPPVTGRELNRLATLLSAVREARSKIRSADPPCPTLAEAVSEMVDLEPLERRIRRALDRRGEVRPDASPELVRLRGQIRSVRDGLYNELRGYLQEHKDDLGDDTIPMRGGRLVLTLGSGSKGRLQGLTHGRSGTGKSFYFEPLAVVESNNRLQQATEDEEAERLRILAELVASAREALPDLWKYAELLAELDLQQAAARYADLTDGRLAEPAPSRQLRLVEARHPLLDPSLQDLRREALGQPGHGKAVVPLDLELDPDKRLLVVTGPNAGGKTVALKTLGLLTLSALCGLPVPAARGTRLPFLAGVIATVGDDQDLLTDRSTFSGRLLRLKEVWEQANDDTLVLLDELGSGTDPEEGSALAISLVEALLERGSPCLITSHLVQVAAAAMEMDGAACAAMEMNAETGEPTFHLQPGPPGGSEALRLARRLGLPAAWLDRAEARLGSEHRDLRRLLSEVEALRQELTESRQRLEEEVTDAAKLRQRLSEEEQELRQERRTLSKRMQRELEDFRQRTAQKLRDEVAAMRSKLEAGRSKKAEADALGKLFREAPDFQAPELEDAGEGGPMEPGATVRHRLLGWEGRLEKLDRGRAEVSVQGKRVRCKEDELVTVAAQEGPKRPRKSRQAARSSGLSTPDASVEPELMLIGERVEPALDRLDVYLDQALLAGRGEVRVVHGHGSGRLRRAVREHLRQHPAVRNLRAGAPNEGGDGATVVALGS